MNHQAILNYNKKFKLFPSCIPVLGSKRSIIIDIERNRFHLIPNSLYDILINNDVNLTISDVVSNHETDHKETILEYFTFLIEHEYIFMFDNNDGDLIPDINLSYYSPSIIDNFILDISDESVHNYTSIFEQVSKLRCPFVQIRVFRILSFAELENILKPTIDKNFESIHLIIKYNSDISNYDLEAIFHRYPISRMDVYASPPAFENLEPDYLLNTNIFFFCDVINDESHCGVIDPSFFSINIRSVSEAVNFNSCLNGKLSIDKFGNIKNCPSMKTSLGNTIYDTLESALRNIELKKYWNITKDQIDVCKGCEFRYICTDCRAYIEEPLNIYSKPLKCGYNPATCEWGIWEKIESKQFAIKEYKLCIGS